MTVLAAVPAPAPPGVMNERAADYVAAFQAFWSAPSADKLATLLHDDALLVHPLGKTVRGMVEARAWMESLLAFVPDLHAVVQRWSASGDTLFIEFRMQASVAGQTVAWSAVDRITLEAGLARERVSYFDAWPLVTTLLRRPAVWPLLLPRALRKR